MFCEICNKEYKNNRALGVHIKKLHNISTEEYFLSYIGEKQKCIVCGKNTKFISLTNGYRKHCCNRCAQLDLDIAISREKSCMEHFGYTNAMKNPYICDKAISKRIQNAKQIAKNNNLIAIPQTANYMLYRICIAYNIDIIKIGQNCFISAECYNEVMTVYNYWRNGYSIFELQILDEIRKLYNGKIDIHNKDIIYPKEIDIYLPELQLAFEIDGNYRHSSKFKNMYYHINKTNLCKKFGIRLVHIFEYEWQDDKQTVKQYIKNAITNIAKTEKCIILDLSKESLLSYPTYNILKILDPILINNVYNCGYAIIEKQ